MECIEVWWNARRCGGMHGGVVECMKRGGRMHGKGW